MTWREAILRVLSESDVPLHYTEIAQQIIDKGYRNDTATPANTVAATLGYEDMKPRIRRTSRGVYTLADSSSDPRSPAPTVAATTAPGDEDANELTAAHEEMGLINAFGMFWARESVDWSARTPRVLGVQQTGSQPVNFANQTGVYLLYDGNRVVYVGRVTSARLGQRLWDHTRDRLTSRWNRFSWFGVRGVADDGSLTDGPAGDIRPDQLIATLEALLIEGLEPPQNRRQGDGFNALEFIQFVDPEIEKRRVQQAVMRASWS
ncbi:HTH domain-containing protein [Gordonia phosphorivorans]|uniref:HTH domain-containing protein n=1 Tax=Gordonia phosphorivorans TaxID=1056982 RepID=A0ABV6HE83_9ACTN